MGAAARADHDSHGSGESEGAGAGDDQDCYGIDYRVREARLRTEDEPCDERDGGYWLRLRERTRRRRDRRDAGWERGCAGLGRQSGQCGRAAFRIRRARRA